MALLLSKIKNFFKRKLTEADSETDGRVSKGEKTKRIKYSSTPGVAFTPRQIYSKRMKRSYYLHRELVSVTEDRNYEFKAGGGMMQTDILKDYICKYGPAFLNAEGGVLMGGVTDDGTVEGVSLKQYQMLRTTETIEDEFRKFRPAVAKDKFRISYVPVEKPRSRDSSLYVIELWVDKGDENSIYENGRNQVYVRRDGGVQGPLRPLSIKDLVIEKYTQVLHNRKYKEKENEFKLEKLRALQEETEILEDKLQALQERPEISEEKNIQPSINDSIEIIDVKKGTLQFKPLPLEAAVRTKESSTANEGLPSKSVANNKENNPTTKPLLNTNSGNNDKDIKSTRNENSNPRKLVPTLINRLLARQERFGVIPRSKPY